MSSSMHSSSDSLGPLQCCWICLLLVARFGEVDIITGRPVRDLRTEPVQQLAQWQRAIFGSRETISESVLDSTDDEI